MKIRTDFVTNSSSSSFTISISVETENGDVVELGKAHEYQELAAEGERYPWYSNFFGVSNHDYYIGKEKAAIKSLTDLIFGVESYCSEYTPDSWLRKHGIIPREIVKITYKIYSDPDGEYCNQTFLNTLYSAGLESIQNTEDMETLRTGTGLSENAIKKIRQLLIDGHGPLVIEKEEYIYQGISKYKIKIGEEEVENTL